MLFNLAGITLTKAVANRQESNMSKSKYKTQLLGASCSICCTSCDYLLLYFVYTVFETFADDLFLAIQGVRARSAALWGTVNTTPRSHINTHDMKLQAKTQIWGMKMSIGNEEPAPDPLLSLRSHAGWPS